MCVCVSVWMYYNTKLRFSSYLYVTEYLFGKRAKQISLSIVSNSKFISLFMYKQAVLS